MESDIYIIINDLDFSKECLYIYIYTPSQPSFSSTSSLELENVKTCSRSDASYKVDVAMY